MPASPIFIQLVMETIQEQPKHLRMLPGLILTASCACDVGEPGPTDEIYDWLKEHPKEHQQVKAALTSTPFRNALWATLATHVRCLHEQQAGFSSACGCKVPFANYSAATGFAPGLDTYQWMKQSASKLAAHDLRGELLLCLAVSYMLPAAGDVLRVPLLEQPTSSMPLSSNIISGSSSSSIGGGQSTNSPSSQAESRHIRGEVMESSNYIQATSSSSSSSTPFSAGSSTHGLATVDWVFLQAITMPDGKAGLANAAHSSNPLLQATSAAPPASPAGTSTTTPSSSSNSVTVATQLQLVLDMLLLQWPSVKGSNTSSSANGSSSSSSSSSSSLRDLNKPAKNDNADNSTESSSTASRFSSSSPDASSTSRDASSSSREASSSSGGHNGDFNISTSSSGSSSRLVQRVAQQPGWSLHSWLLLFMSLLQQADAEAKKQFMGQRAGLLLQLLYHAAAYEELLPVGSATEGLRWLDAQQTAFLLDPAQDYIQIALPRPSMFFMLEMLLQALLYEALPLELMRSESCWVSGSFVNRSGEWCSRYHGIW